MVCGKMVVLYPPNADNMILNRSAPNFSQPRGVDLIGPSWKFPPFHLSFRGVSWKGSLRIDLLTSINIFIY